MEWQPMETAPKDGTVFLAYEFSEDCGLGEGIIACRWIDNKEEALIDDCIEGWWECNSLTGDYLEYCTLLYWMPLPNPPKERE